MRTLSRWCVSLCVLVWLCVVVPLNAVSVTNSTADLAAATPPPLLGDDPLPTPLWTSTDCTAPFTECAVVKSYKNWGQRNKDWLSFYVERLQSIPASAVTVWLVSDTLNNVNLVTALRKAHINVVRFHPRGGKYADPQLVCSEDAVSATKNCWPDATCAQQLRNKGVKLEQYAIEQVARDLQWVLSSLGRGTHNVILGEGLASAIVTHYLLLFPNEANTDLGVVLVDPVYPGLDKEAFDSTKAFYRHVDAAAQHLLSLCDAQPVCAARLGAEGSAWARLQNIQQAIASGALPCVKEKKLQWTAASGSTSQDRAVRETLAAMVSPYQFFAPSDPNLLALVPSVLYRLQRCNDKDVSALNHLHDYLLGGAHVSECPVNTPLYMSWLSNEFRNRTRDSTATAQSILDAALKDLDLTLVPGHRDMTSFFHFDETVAHYPSSAHLWPGIYQGAPQVLILTSDMDAVYAPGQSAKLTLHFAQATAHQLRGGGAAHLPSSEAMRTCLVNQLRQYARSFTWGTSELCTLNEPGNVDLVKVDATTYYGVADAWQFTVPHGDEPMHGKTRDDDDEGGTSSATHRLRNAVIVLVVIGLVALAALYGWRWYVRYRNAQMESDDIFDHIY